MESDGPGSDDPDSDDRATDGGGDQETSRVTDLQRRLEDRLANPLLRRLLRSPLHPLASRWFLLCSYRGRRSDRRYTIPLLYARVTTNGDGEVVVLTPREETVWWTNFRKPRACSLVLGGRERPATGTVVARSEAGPFLAAYFRTYPAMGRLLGYGSDPTTTRAGRGRASRELAVVRFRLENGETGG